MSDQNTQPEDDQEPVEPQDDQGSSEDPELDEATQNKVDDADEDEDADPENLNGPAGEAPGAATI